MAHKSILNERGEEVTRMPLPNRFEAAERRIADKVSKSHIIPPITDPLGRHWKQPDRFSIEIDDNYAMMSPGTYEQLANYSHTLPTGTYPGKMWRMESRQASYLAWYGDVRGNQIDIHYREILVVV